MWVQISLGRGPFWSVLSPVDYSTKFPDAFQLVPKHWFAVQKRENVYVRMHNTYIDRNLLASARYRGIVRYEIESATDDKFTNM